MGQLRYVTLTGVDEHTDFDRMRAMSEKNFDLEWGVIYSPAEVGKSTRHPPLPWLDAFANRADQADMNIALHLCGGAVKALMQAAATRTYDGAAKQILDLAEKFGRVQLNMRAKESDLSTLKELVSRLTRTEKRTRVILQWNDHNMEVCRRLSHEYGFEVLIDSSGGRGRERTEWPKLDRFDAKRLGMAGGLGPDNLEVQLPRISEAAGDRTFWVDMEGKLRDAQDRFDLDVCEKVLMLVEAFKAAQDLTQAQAYGSGTRKVATLKGLWLDWWVGAAMSRNLVVPPQDACRAMTLERHTGDYNGYQPSEDRSMAMQILKRERIALTPAEEDDRWIAKAAGKGHPEMLDDEMHIAGLRAVVAKHFGDRVACNPFDSKAGGGYLVR